MPNSWAVAPRSRARNGISYCLTTALAFWEDLLVAYPEAKVVLMERDVERWFRSFDDAVIKVMWGWWGNKLADLERGFVGRLRDVHIRWAKDWMRVHSEREMRAKARERYQEHYQMVRSVVPKERLLEYELGSGWRPLCEFLGRKIPDVEFPRVNETASMQEKIRIIVRRGVIRLLTKIFLWLGPFVLAFLLWRRFYY